MCFKKTLIFLCSAALLSTLWSAAYAAEPTAISVPGSPSPASLQVALTAGALQPVVDAAAFPLITLPPVPATRLQALKKEPSLPTRIGFSRNVVQLAATEDTGRQLQWRKGDNNGHSAGLQIRSPQALALRVGMSVDKLPAGAELRFFRMEDGTAVEVQRISGQEILDLLQANLEADPTDPDGRIFWSPTVKGDTLGVEISLPAGEDPAVLQIAFPLISHIDLSPFATETLKNATQAYGESDPCQNDATCAIAWRDISKSVAGMQFTTSGGTFVCTGSLLNDMDPTTWQPYFITANHCISTQAAASTVETHWFWESSICNVASLSPSYTRIPGGATLLHTQGMSPGTPTGSSMDTTLLRLNSAAPAGAYFAGWSTALPLGYGTTRTGIHHPKADWKKISYGTAGNNYACGWLDADGFSCTSGDGNFYEVSWFSGGTEGGSSGSALYAADQLLIGTLTGGNESCGGSFSAYSSFRAAYAAGNYGQWLNTAPPPPAPESSTAVVAPLIYLLLK